MGFQREDQWPRRGHWLGFPAPHPGLCPPPPLPSGPTGQTCLLLLITIAASPPRARLAQERSLPSGALSEDVTGLTICLPNRQGVGVGRGSPQPELCPPGAAAHLPLQLLGCAVGRPPGLCWGPSWPPPAPLGRGSPCAEGRSGAAAWGCLAPAHIPGRPAPRSWAPQHLWVLRFRGPTQDGTRTEMDRYFRLGCERDRGEQRHSEQV